MFLVEKVLAKSNMYTRYVLYLIGIAILSFSFIKRNTIIHNLVRHSTEMKKFLPSHQKKTPLGPCSQRVAASCVAREPQHQQNINKSSPAWSPVASGFSMLRVWWRIGKPKAKVLPLLESFRKSMSKTCQANLRSRGGGGGIYQKKQLRTEELHFIHFKKADVTKTPTPKSQASNSSSQIAKKKSRSPSQLRQPHLSVDAAPATGIAPGVIQATKWWTTSQDQVDAAPLIFGTSGRSLFSLTHCKPMRKSISKIYVPTSGIFVWPLANTAAKSQNCLPLMVSKKAVLVAGTCDWHSCYQICAENTAQSPQWIWHLMHVSLSCSKLWVLGCL